MADLPEPLVPADVDLRGMPYTPIFRGRLFGSGFHAQVSDAGWRAGVTLWLKSWDQMPAGTLPTDDVQLARLAEFGRDVKGWLKVKVEALWGWILCSDQRLHHKTVAEGVTEAWKQRLAQRDRTAKARATKTAKTAPQTRENSDDRAVTDNAAEPVTTSVTDLLQRPREGKGREVRKKESPGLVEPEPGPRSPPAGLEHRCRAAVGDEPCLVDPNFGPILALLDEAEITEADVLAGIAAGLAKADPGFRFRHWRQFANWIRGAAKDRLGKSTRQVGTAAAGQPTTEIRGVQVPESRVVDAIDLWEKTGAWPELWSPPPGQGGCEIPRRLWPAKVLAEAAA